MDELVKKRLYRALFYSELDYKSKNAVNALKNLKENKEYKLIPLSDALNISMNCTTIFERVRNNMNDDAWEYYKLVIQEEAYNKKGKNLEETLKEKKEKITRINHMLMKIIRGNSVQDREIEEGIDFFNQFEKICKLYSKEYLPI